MRAELRIHRDPRAAAEALARRVVSPLTGLVPSIGFYARVRRGTRVVLTTCDLAGVHHLVGGPAARPGAHHIGAASLSATDAVIRSLAESIERYAHYAFPAHHRFAVAPSAHPPGPAVPPEALFDDDQFADPGFPFDRPDPAAPLGWWRMTELTGGPDLFVPAQSTLVGYRPGEAEPWLHPAVSTGTAAHTDPGAALLNAVQELVQLDATMGHWHTATRSVRIGFDQRTRAPADLVDRYWDDRAPRPEFHLLPSTDLPGFTVACLLRAAAVGGPAVSVGLGAAAGLTTAMVKALVEGTALVSLFSTSPVPPGEEPDEEPARFLDLNGNVTHYSEPGNARVVEDRFADCDTASASDLPPDVTTDTRDAVHRYLAAFRATGKRLLYGDLTTPDVRRLGFHVPRVWSPDLLPLSLPGAPARRHRRYLDYGGYRPSPIHPYP
ncbi:hypothetical protein SUDANB95_01985 [Actinosynnema sp. ALI-1.44]